MDITNIIAEARGLVDATATSYPASASTDLLFIRINSAYEEIIGDLIAIDKRWKFDDTNYSDLPLGTADLVDNQRDYAFSTALLGIERIEIQDINGNWNKLISIEERKIREALEEYESINGIPTQYSVRGNSLFLYPTPAAASVTTTAGMKVYFRRTADVFTEDDVSTGTKVPGFASPYHQILAYKAALPYARTYKKDRVISLERETQRIHTKLIAHYNNQNKDKLNRMVPIYQNNR